MLQTLTLLNYYCCNAMLLNFVVIDEISRVADSFMKCYERNIISDRIILFMRTRYFIYNSEGIKITDPLYIIYIYFILYYICYYNIYIICLILYYLFYIFHIIILYHYIYFLYIWYYIIYCIYILYYMIYIYILCLTLYYLLYIWYYTLYIFYIIFIFNKWEAMCYELIFIVSIDLLFFVQKAQTTDDVNANYFIR